MCNLRIKLLEQKKTYLGLKVRQMFLRYTKNTIYKLVMGLDR